MMQQNNKHHIPLRTAIGLHAFRLYKYFETLSHELRFLFWECTLRCNLQCRHCGSDCEKNSCVPDMPRNDFLQVLDEVRERYDSEKILVVVTGGEPLLREDLDECGQEFYKRRFPWGIVTNGYLLTRMRLQSLIENGLRSITVSIDGLVDAHTWLRGKNDSFEKALSAIQLCGGSPQLAFDVVTCVHQKNIHELEQLRELLISHNVKQWRLFTIFPRGRAAADPELKLTSREFLYLMDFIAETRRLGIIHASYGCEGFLGRYEGKVRDSFFFCRAGISTGSVMANGSISACPSLRGDYTQGNIYAGSFIDCWEKGFLPMRNRAWARTGACASCTVFCWCQGNGLHLRDEKTGNILFCHYSSLFNTRPE